MFNAPGHRPLKGKTMQTSRLKTSLVAASLLALTAWPIAQAQTAPTTATLGFQQVIDRITEQGYRDVREVEREGDKLYEIKARDAQGHWVELLVDARSGEILKRELKDGPRKHERR